MPTEFTSPVRVACVGDSITYGHGVRDEHGDSSYPAVLARLLGSGWDVRNFGVSGATLLRRGDLPYAGTSACADALAFRPDIAVIKLGTNDSKLPRPGAHDAPGNWYHKSEYAGDYHSLIVGFRSANPTVRVFVCVPAPAFPGNWGIDDETIRDEIAPLVRAVADRAGADLIDLHAALSARPDCFPDTVHPDATGAALIAAEIFRHVATHAPGHRLVTASF